MAQHRRLLIALIAGVIAGAALHPLTDSPGLNAFNTHLLQPLGQVFLRLIFMVVVPLVFSALALGAFELGREHGLGKVAGRTFAYTLLASSLSVAIGIVLINTLRPGVGFQINSVFVQSQASNVQTISKNASEAKPFSQALVELIPKNPIDSAARALSGEIIAVMVFALIFGIAMSRIGGRKDEDGPVAAVLREIYAICMKVIDYAMKLAPIGVFAIVFNTVFKFGYEILGALLFYVLVVLAALLIQQFGVYAALLKWKTRWKPLHFFKECSDVYLYAFSTASSNATLPTSLEVAEKKLRLPPRISRFVLTVGSTANQNGTALFEGITVLFLAQVYNVNLSLGQQIQVVLASILAGIGTAGVPGGSLPLIMILLQSVGIPAEGMGLILGVDRFLDMCRTTLNVSGDLVIAALVSEGEHKYLQESPA